MEPPMQYAAPTASLPPMAAPADDFRVGEQVVHPMHGVGRIAGIKAERYDSNSIDMITVTFEDNRLVMRIPCAKAPRSGLRRPVKADIMDEALGLLRGRARGSRSVWTKKSVELRAKLNSGDVMAVAEVVRDTSKPEAALSFGEREIHEAALNRLAAEYAAIEGVSRMEALLLIEARASRQLQAA
jgi:CarD family transcriptional regulator